MPSSRINWANKGTPSTVAKLIRGNSFRDVLLLELILIKRLGYFGKRSNTGNWSACSAVGNTEKCIYLILC